MGLVNDMAESIVGDITPHDPISNEEKARLEQVLFLTCLAVSPKFVIYLIYRKHL